MAAQIDLQFIVSGDTASYRINRYGHPDHGRRVEVRHHVQPLYTYKGCTQVYRHYNYTPTEYAHEVARVAGYMWRESGATEPLDLEYARAYNDRVRENYARTLEKYGPEVMDWPMPLLKGTAYLVKVSGEGFDAKYTWMLVNL